MVSAYQYCVVGKFGQRRRVQFDGSLSTCVETDRRDSGDSVELECAEVVAVSEAMERDIKVCAGVCADLDHADVEGHPGSICFLSGVTAEVCSDVWPWEPRVGGHSVDDGMTEVDVARHCPSNLLADG